MFRKPTILTVLMAVLGLAVVPAKADSFRQTTNKKVAAATTCTEALNACLYFCEHMAKLKKACRGTCNRRQRACLRSGTYKWRTQADSVGLERR